MQNELEEKQMWRSEVNASHRTRVHVEETEEESERWLCNQAAYQASLCARVLRRRRWIKDDKD